MPLTQQPNSLPKVLRSPGGGIAKLPLRSMRFSSTTQQTLRKYQAVRFFTSWRLMIVLMLLFIGLIIVTMTLGAIALGMTIFRLIVDAIIAVTVDVLVMVGALVLAGVGLLNFVLNIIYLLRASVF